jgi:hypothetical protein
MKEVRLLKPNEIDCRVATINEKGLSLLLYKDARVDMAILDELFGSENWKRTHEVINGNLFCNIEVWNKEIGEWVKKQDVGTESYTEKEKGQASDSFKRAGFNWGIGRELYTAPFIWITPRDDKEIFKNSKGSFTTYTKFTVKEIGYNENNEISKLIIIDDKGKVRFNLTATAPKKEEGKKEEVNYRDLLVKYINKEKMDFTEIAKEHKLNTKTTNAKFKEVYEILTASEAKK